jgi:hypothetical protein
MFIEGATTFEDSGWYTATLSTPALTLHAVYREAEDVRCVGLAGPTIDRPFARTLIATVESLPAEALRRDYGYVRVKVGRFDGLGHVSGPHRRFLNGWAGQTALRIVHLFPCYDSEVAGLEERAFLESFRTLAVFDTGREPNPHFEIQMQGRKSQLRIKKWAKVPYAQLVTYAKILENESGTLSIRNIRGEVLEFGGKNGWRTAADRIRAHVFVAA